MPAPKKAVKKRSTKTVRVRGTTVECPYNPKECHNSFRDLQARMKDLEAKVDALPNGSKLDKILNTVEATGLRVNNLSRMVGDAFARIDGQEASLVILSEEQKKLSSRIMKHLEKMMAKDNDKKFEAILDKLKELEKD